MRQSDWTALAILGAIVLLGRQGKAAPRPLVRPQPNVPPPPAPPAGPLSVDVPPDAPPAEPFPFPAHVDPLDAPELVFPIAGPSHLLSPYGAMRAGGHIHYGVDLAAPEGASVLAMVEGDIHYGHDKDGGNVAVLKPKSGALYYAHLERFEGENRHVKAGDVIGYVGMTGNAATTQPHLHLELWPTGSHEPEPPDPTPLLDQAHAAQSATVAP